MKKFLLLSLFLCSFSTYACYDKGIITDLAVDVVERYGFTHSDMLPYYLQIPGKTSIGFVSDYIDKNGIVRLKKASVSVIMRRNENNGRCSLEYIGLGKVF